MAEIKVADEVWVATALLHREHPERRSFRNGEIIARAEREAIHGPLRPGIQVHVSLHCVANKAPNPGAYRMLFETPDGGRRLYRPGDPAHPARGGKSVPKRDELPRRYHPLLDWYQDVYVPQAAAAPRPRNVAEAPVERYAADTDERGRKPAAAVDNEVSPPEHIDWRDRIIEDGSILLGKPVVRGTRLAVDFLVELLAHGWRHEEILRNYPGLTEVDLRACLAYSAEHLRLERVYPLSAT